MIAVSRVSDGVDVTEAVAVASIISSLKSLGFSPKEVAELMPEIGRAATVVTSHNKELIDRAYRAAISAGLEGHLAIGLACTPLVAAGVEVAEIIAKKVKT